jgi:hypothetical protein
MLLSVRVKESILLTFQHTVRPEYHQGCISWLEAALSCVQDIALRGQMRIDYPPRVRQVPVGHGQGLCRPPISAGPAKKTSCTSLAGSPISRMPCIVASLFLPFAHAQS